MNSRRIQRVRHRIHNHNVISQLLLQVLQLPHRVPQLQITGVRRVRRHATAQLRDRYHVKVVPALQERGLHLEGAPDQRCRVHARRVDRALIVAVRTRERVVVVDAVERLRDQHLDHLVDEEDDVLGLDSLHFDCYVPVGPGDQR